jgi:hypothetical protein
MLASEAKDKARAPSGFSYIYVAKDILCDVYYRAKEALACRLCMAKVSPRFPPAAHQKIKIFPRASLSELLQKIYKMPNAYPSPDFSKSG